MEHPARFELSSALEAWRGELLSEAAFTPDDRRELEAHLCDAMDESRGSGMDDERAFSLARHRIGPVADLAREFSAANPAIAWRERAFWMATALLLNKAWMIGAIVFLLPVLNSQPAPLFAFVSYAPLLGVAVLLSRGRIALWVSWSSRAINSRTRFAIAMAVLIISLHWMDTAHVFRGDPFHWIVAQCLSFSLSDIFLIALGAWLMPAQYRQYRSSAARTTNPASASAWRERVFWMTLAILVQIIWTSLGVMSANLINDGAAKLVPSYHEYRAQVEYGVLGLLIKNALYSLLGYLPPLCLLALLAHGRAGHMAEWFRRVFNTRGRLAFAAGLAMFVMRAWHLTYYDQDYSFVKWRLLLWNFTFVALAAWLMPAQYRNRDAVE